MKIKLLDNNFISDLGSSKECPPTKFEWDRTIDSSDIVVFTDSCLALADLPTHKNAYKIATVFEPFPINPRPYQHLAKYHHKFNLILSHNMEFVNRLGDKGQFFYNGMTLIPKENRVQVEKTKLISIVVSTKNMTADHGFRLEVVKAIKDKGLPVDLFGKGFNFVENKADGLSPYMFSIALENCQIDSYISDKIHDPILTFTHPIYRGCDKTKDFFNMDGITTVQTLDDTIKAIETVLKDGEKIYNDSLPAMQENFEKVQPLLCAEDWIYENVLVPRKLV